MKEDSGSKLGNRVWLGFELDDQKYRFIYGHLDDFEGADRLVEPNDVIGYAGCTGNVEPNTCDVKNECGLSSDHVHLLLLNDTTGRYSDPLDILFWPLRYFTDDERVRCRDVVPTSKGIT